ncbi:MAG: thioesterase family protein [Rhodoferax sp.]|uniref:acyl-CoA thioesterase n=1 Tax=Rhodoferax sp. TaxID=50421 RepID=UPI0027269B02|nr:thioesterase family protein [Rhodoferax sp.]MDO8450251.1 thioesterase family protein [Rhodoferax sp.]
MTSHPFDIALHLTPDFGVKADQFLGTTSADWWNMVGPFGGMSAAIVLNAVMTHPSRLGDPVALTVNFASAMSQGGFKAVATPVRTNRSTQHWLLELRQADANGMEAVVLTGTAITAVRRDTWSANDMPMPEVAPADAVARILPPTEGVVWIQRYDMRPVTGLLPSTWDGGASSDDPQLASLTQLWIRDDPPRPLDFASLAAMADVFFPRIWLRRSVLVPVGTVSLTVYFHAGTEQLAESGTGYLLGQARGQAFRNGFFDQAGLLWSANGTLLATTHQLVYFKE